MAFAAELIALVPWDDEEHGLPSRFVDHPQFSWGVPEHTRRVRAPVRVRLDSEGGLQLAGDGSAIVHLAADGSPAGGPRRPGRSPTTPATLTATAPSSRTGSGLDRGGASAGPVEADSTKLLSTGDRVYLPRARRPRRAGRRLRGAGCARCRAAPVPARRFSAAGGSCRCSSTSSASCAGSRPSTSAAATRSSWPRGEEHYAWLTYPFGADAHSRLYVWSDGQVGRVALDGTIDVLGTVGGIAVQGGAVYTSRPWPGASSSPDRRARPRSPRRPASGSSPSTPAGATACWAAKRRTARRAADLRAGGSLEATAPPPQDLATIDCRVPDFSAWQVDGDGRVVVPGGHARGHRRRTVRPMSSEARERLEALVGEWTMEAGPPGGPAVARGGGGSASNGPKGRRCC